jgi:SAM-dependent methyltransferase
VASEFEWDIAYKSGAHRSRYPNSDLVSKVIYYSRKLKLDLQRSKVLEYGFGAGNNIQFILDCGASYFGIEQSETAVNLARLHNPEIANQLICGDFREAKSLIPHPGGFDLIINRASITHNSCSDIKEIVKSIHEQLLPGGLFIGVDWFGTDHSEFRELKLSEFYTHEHAFTEGYFKGLGIVHFTSKEEIEEIFCEFDILSIESVSMLELQPNPRIKEIFTYSIVAKKGNKL